MSGKVPVGQRRWLAVVEMDVFVDDEQTVTDLAIKGWNEIRALEGPVVKMVEMSEDGLALAQHEIDLEGVWP